MTLPSYTRSATNCISSTEKNEGVVGRRLAVTDKYGRTEDSEAPNNIIVGLVVGA